MFHRSHSSKDSILRGLESLDVDRALAYLGLQRERSLLGPAIGFFSAGVLLGVGIALMIAPESGRVTRQRIAQTGNKVVSRVSELARRNRSEVVVEIPEEDRAPQTAFGTEGVHVGTGDIGRY